MKGKMCGRFPQICALHCAGGDEGGKLKICVRLLPALLLALLLCACGAQAETEEQKSEEGGDTFQIGVSYDSIFNARWQRDGDVFVSAAQELCAGVIEQKAYGELQEQIDQINYFIQKKMDVIVIVQVASGDEVSDLIPAIEKAQKAGIPVISYDRLIMNAGVDLYISFDNVEVGRLMAEHMREHLGDEGVILQICGPMVDYNVPQVMSGFEEVLSGSDITIGATEYADEWKPETGFTVTSAYLKTNIAPDGVMCGNDGLAGQTIRALSERRLAGKVCVVGQDADLEACQRIVEGTQCMTVYKPVEKLARRAAEIAIQLAQDGEVEAEEYINDGTYDVPFVKLEPVAVTKENMDEVITGKYHEASDI